MSGKEKSLIREMKVVVVKRKIRRKDTGAVLLQESKKYIDPSFDCEKFKNPLEFKRASYVTALSAKELWPRLNIPITHIHNLFGEPTRIRSHSLEWAVRIPSKEILKIVISGKNRVSVHGFNRTPTVERWVERLINS